MTPLQLAERCREKLAEMREAEQAATPGPWSIGQALPRQVNIEEGRAEDWLFISTSRTWLPALLSFAEQRLARAVVRLLPINACITTTGMEAEQEIRALAECLGVEE